MKHLKKLHLPIKYMWKLTLWGLLANFFFYACIGKEVYVGTDAAGNDQYVTDCGDWCGESYSVSSKGSTCYDADSRTR